MKIDLRRWFAITALLATSVVAAGCEDDDPTTPDPLAAPTALTAAPASQQVALTWQAVPGAESYTVQRAEGATGGTFADLGTTASTSYTATGMTANTTYRFRVFATRGDETGPAAEVQTATTNLPVALIGADITADRRFRADTIYRLTNFVHVGNGARLTIDAGTRIEGEQGSAQHG